MSTVSEQNFSKSTALPGSWNLLRWMSDICRKRVLNRDLSQEEAAQTETTQGLSPAEEKAKTQSIQDPPGGTKHHHHHPSPSAEIGPEQVRVAPQWKSLASHTAWCPLWNPMHPTTTSPAWAPAASPADPRRCCWLRNPAQGAGSGECGAGAVMKTGRPGRSVPRILPPRPRPPVRRPPWLPALRPFSPPERGPRVRGRGWNQAAPAGNCCGCTSGLYGRAA